MVGLVPVALDARALLEASRMVMVVPMVMVMVVSMVMSMVVSMVVVSMVVFVL